MNRIDDQFATYLDLAVKLARTSPTDALLLLMEGPTDWIDLLERTRGEKVLLAADTEAELEGAAEAGIPMLVLHMTDAPVVEKLTQALLLGVSQELLPPSANVVALYSGFEPGTIDTISRLHLDEHLGRLTSRDLQQLGTKVPLETLKSVVDLAIEIGREGREGKPIGTMFVVGDHKKVLARSHPAGFDPVRGYCRKERNLHDARVREGIKEIAQMDGAFIVSPDGTVEAACRLVEMGAANITLSKGLGSRHWAAAAITKSTRSIAVVVSQSNGTVRIFQNGEVVLRVEPFRRAMKWKDFEFDPPPQEAS